MKQPFCIILFVVLSMFAHAKNKPTHLNINFMHNPIGLDAANVEYLRFGWRIEDGMQTAYRIQLSNGWDSDKKKSTLQNGILYTGPELTSKTSYKWKLKIWVDGKETEWVESSFETGILKPIDWKGQWVFKAEPEMNSKGELLNNQFNLIRQSFDLPSGKKIERARAYISAELYNRGLYGFRINGKRPEGAVLMDNNDKRYYTLDVTEYLLSGKNAFGVMFGDTGTVRPALHKELPREPAYRISTNLFIADIDVWFTDGSHITIGTDNTAIGTEDGPILQADEFDGEHYDARKEINWSNPTFNTSEWNACNIDKKREKPRNMHTDWVKIAEIMKPVAITNPKPGVYVFDVGTQISGLQMLKVKGAAGTRIQFRFAEILDDDGMLARHTILNGLPALQIDSYTLKGDGVEIWQPELTWHGFRYMEVTGFPGIPTENDISIRRISGDILREKASFNCSNAALNRIHRAFYDTQLGNAVFDQTDCNQRGERAPWSADAFCVSEASMSFFDMPYFWQEKWLNVINSRVGQHGESNELVYQSGGGFRLLWGSHAVRIPWDFYQAYGDKAYLEKTYDRASKFADCLINWYDKLDVVITDDRKKVIEYTSKEDWLIDAESKWKLKDGKEIDNDMMYHGDWVRPDGKWMENVSFINSATYFYCAKLTSLIAAELNKTKEATYYANVAENVRKAINAKWMVEENGKVFYCNNHQTFNAMAIHYGIVPVDKIDAVVESLNKNISDSSMHLSTGALGTLSVIPALSRNGSNEVVWKLAQQTTDPSWLGMINRGPGTFAENWMEKGKDISNSLSHPFLGGSIAAWMHQVVAGIKPAKPGYEVIEIRPQITGELTFCEASIPTVRGMISSNWKLDSKTFILNVSIPGNTTAQVYLPGDTKFKTIGPGTHTFKVDL